MKKHEYKISSQDLDEIIQYIEDREVIISAEWDYGYNVNELMERGLMPDLYNRLIELRNNNTQKR